MPTTRDIESTLTDRYQTTVPDAVRRALKLGKRDKIRYTVRRDGTVVLARSLAEEAEDPVLARFLEFLARDFAEHPARIRSLDAKFASRMKALVKGVKIDLGAALPPESE